MWNFLELKLRWLLRWALAPEFHYATPGTRHMASHYLIGWAYPTVKPQDQSVFWKTSFEDVRRCSLQETNTSLYSWRSWLKSSFWLDFHLEASSSSYLLTNERRLSEHVLVLMFLHNHQGTVYSITNPRKRFSPMLSELVTSTILNSALEALKSPTTSGSLNLWLSPGLSPTVLMSIYRAAREQIHYVKRFQGFICMFD